VRVIKRFMEAKLSYASQRTGLQILFLFEVVAEKKTCRCCTDSFAPATPWPGSIKQL
jgi:hypothetical protein